MRLITLLFTLGFGLVGLLGRAGAEGLGPHCSEAPKLLNVRVSPGVKSDPLGHQLYSKFMGFMTVSDCLAVNEYDPFANFRVVILSSEEGLSFGFSKKQDGIWGQVFKVNIPEAIESASLEIVTELSNRVYFEMFGLNPRFDLPIYYLKSLGDELGNNVQLFKNSLDGSHEERLTTQKGLYALPSLSPNKDVISVVQMDESDSKFRYIFFDARSGEEVFSYKLKSVFTSKSAVSFSGDGKKAYSSVSRKDQNILSFDLATGKVNVEPFYGGEIFSVQTYLEADGSENIGFHLSRKIDGEENHRLFSSKEIKGNLVQGEMKQLVMAELDIMAPAFHYQTGNFAMAVGLEELDLFVVVDGIPERALGSQVKGVDNISWVDENHIVFRANSRQNQYYKRTLLYNVRNGRWIELTRFSHFGSVAR